ncbi:MAG: hypothetical protein HY815_04610 [Candidatus Riflebacteria bacterium]|nr:hypothetical protein [Candidatus Riflebacteria bacterium]
MTLVRVANYRILERLGSGGTGTVYKAIQEPLNRVVALKVLHASWAQLSTLVERFRREAGALACLNHPNLARLYDAGRGGRGVTAGPRALRGAPATCPLPAGG